MRNCEVEDLSEEKRLGETLRDSGERRRRRFFSNFVREFITRITCGEAAN